MSTLVARILLSMLMVPMAVLVYALSVAVADQAIRSGSYPTRNELVFLIATAATWVSVAAYWCLLWRTGVRWTRARIAGTVASPVAALVVASLAGVVLAAFGDGNGGNDGGRVGTFVGGVLAIVVWLFATIFLWRETAAERAARVRAVCASTIPCPNCGHNLTGLGDARCPECGSRFTLDELLAAQPARVAAAAVAELE